MINLWQCCGKNYSEAVKTCKVCKKPKQVYGIKKDKPQRVPAQPKTHRTSKKIIPGRDSPIESKDFKYCTSTLHLKKD